MVDGERAVRSLGDAWERGLALSGGRVALTVGGESLTYDELDTRARSIAHAVQTRDPDGTAVAVFAARSVDAYLGVLASVLAGRTYVPLHPDFPVHRSAAMLTRSGATSMVIGAESDPVCGAVIDAAGAAPVMLFPTRATPPWATRFGADRAIGLDEFGAAAGFAAPSVDSDSIAYLLFTSGSTGQPKGVGVTQANVAAYLEHVVPAFGYSPSDHCSQMFDLTFDLSVHDLFVTWMAGARLCVPTRRSVLAPAKYIRDSGLTTWFSVPSIAMVMDRLRMLPRAAYPGLRLTLFCGEALTAGIAAKWAASAPNSRVHNLYGPTEATIAITSFEWPRHSTASGVVPLGEPFPNHCVAVVDDQGFEVPAGKAGELCLAGPQVTPGYWNDPVRTSERFVSLPQSTERWYRTGDLVERSDVDGLRYHGRVDDQVQILGFRVELVEVDVAVRRALGSELAVAVSYPAGPAAESIYAFAVAADGTPDEAAALGNCRDMLPPYMVPRRIFFVEALPLNSNGKVDRGALRERLGGLVDA